MSNAPNFTFPAEWIMPLAMAAVAAVLAAVAWRIARRQARRRQASAQQAQLAICLNDFAEPSVADTGPQLRVYNVPVRLALVVMAPVGRDGRLPDREIWPSLIDRAIPQIRDVVAAHQTELRPWPNQLSTEGFCTKFFHALSMPARGKGTAWTAVAGRITAVDNRYLIGLLLRGKESNNLSQYTIERDAQWLDVLRIDAQDNRSR